MKVFVTGGAGFIGSHFVREYLAKHPDDEIVNFDLLTYAGHLSTIEDVRKSDRHTFVQGDIRSADQVRQAMAGCDAVVHFAAESHVDRSIAHPQDFVLTNVLGTQVLLEVAKELGVNRFHHVSTDEVFGALPLNSQERFAENTPYNPHSPYSASKAAADHFVRAYFDTYGLAVTLSNCSNNYGPYHHPEKLIPKVITNALRGEPITLYGDGLHVRDWLYVTDHVAAIDLILHQGKSGETYLIGGHGERNNKQVVETLLRYLQIDVSKIEYVADRPGHDRRYAIDPTKIEQELGWQPAVSLEEGLQKTVDWYRDNPDWWNPLLSDAKAG